MKNQADINQLLQMTIGQIKRLEKSQIIIQDVIDQQKESVAFVIEQERLNDNRAEKFLEELR